MGNEALVQCPAKRPQNQGLGENAKSEVEPVLESC